MDILNQLILELSKIPTLGPKASTRIAFSLLEKDENFNQNLADLISRLKKEIKACKICSNYSSSDICPICQDETRDKKTICVVESTTELLSFENTKSYNGLYHVLNGRISPFNGVFPEMLNIKTLKERIQNADVKEIIFALSPCQESSMTEDYILNFLKENLDEEIFKNLVFSKLSLGLNFGSDIDYQSAKTLSIAIENRVKIH